MTTIKIRAPARIHQRSRRPHPLLLVCPQRGSLRLTCCAEIGAKDYPFILPGDQLYWLGSTLHDPGSRIVQAYVQTGKFLVDQGRLSSAPSAAQVAQHVDITFIKKALAGGCSS